MLLTKMKTEDLIFYTDKWEWKNIMFKVFSIPVPEEASWKMEKGRLKMYMEDIELTASGFILDKEFFHGQESIMMDIIDGYKRASYNTVDAIKNGKNYVSQKFQKNKFSHANVVSFSFELINRYVILNFAVKSDDKMAFNKFEEKLNYMVENTVLIMN